MRMPKVRNRLKHSEIWNKMGGVYASERWVSVSEAMRGKLSVKKEIKLLTLPGNVRVLLKPFTFNVHICFEVMKQRLLHHCQVWSGSTMSGGTEADVELKLVLGGGSESYSCHSASKCNLHHTKEESLCQWISRGKALKAWWPHQVGRVW